MFNQDFSNAELAAMVTAVEVPAEQDRMRADGAWAMPDTAVEHLQLPMGPNWIITTPLSVRVEDGVITCAEEGEHANCLELQ
jgi:hypothetical protein